jgi:hypothetical protein
MFLRISKKDPNRLDANLELCPYQLKERRILRMHRLTMVHSPDMNWLISASLEREIYFYEGVHLGSRLQGRLYDR